MQNRKMSANYRKKGANFTEKGLKYMQKVQKNPVRCTKFIEKSTQIAVIVGPTLGNSWSCWQTSLLAFWHYPNNWSNTQRFNSRSTVAGPTSILQLRTNDGFWVVGPTLAKNILADCNWVIFPRPSIRVISIMQKSITYFFMNNL